MTYTVRAILKARARVREIAARPCEHVWNDDYIITVCEKCRVRYPG